MLFNLCLTRSHSQSQEEFGILFTKFDILLSQINNEFPLCSIVTGDFNARWFLFFFFKLGFTLCKAKRPLRGMELPEKKHKKITGYRKSVQKDPAVKRCLLILDLKPLRLQVKGKHYIGREFQSLAVQGKKLLTQTSL